MSELEASRTAEPDILDDAALARRWCKDQQDGISPEAIARWLDRISNKKRAGHLKSFKAGNKRLYRLEDVMEYENARAKNSWLSLMQLTDDDIAELDPAIVAELIDATEPKPTQPTRDFDPNVMNWINEAKRNKK